MEYDVKRSQLCDDDGYVADKYLVKFNARRKFLDKEPVEKDFVCTGSEHFGSMVIYCTSPAHEAAFGQL
jgi:hypothetical protein